VTHANKNPRAEHSVTTGVSEVQRQRKVSSRKGVVRHIVRHVANEKGHVTRCCKQLPADAFGMTHAQERRYISSEKLDCTGTNVPAAIAG